MTRLYFRNLCRFIIPVVLIYTVLCSASNPPAASPAAETELICHTNNPAECYPKVFSPTEEFQIVHDDQDLPPGLHVQLDVQTGQKQAKLYNPEEAENPALAGLPVNQEVIVVDPESPINSEPRIPPGAPAYEPVGVVKAPQEKNEGFSHALQIIKKFPEDRSSIGTGALDEALGVLDDWSHDIYYGLQIAEDSEAVRSLFCLLLDREETGEERRPSTEQTRFLASSVLSATVGNNARALAAIEQSWDDITELRCGASSHSIKHELFRHLAPTSEAGSQQESDEIQSIRFYLTVIGGLLKSPKIRTEFLDNDGMQSFLQILLRDGGAWESRKAKVAQITSDTFLDEDFGAALGIWPRQHQADASKCGGVESQSFDDACWGYHLAKIRRGARAPEWSKHLLSLIQRAQIPDSRPERNEL